MTGVRFNDQPKMLAVMDEVSDTVVHDLIRSWRLARLSSDAAIGWPKTTLLGRVVEFGTDIVASIKGRFSMPTPDDNTDADWVQVIVEKMPYELRSVFEAYHLGIIREQVCRNKPHKARALMLGISYETYNRRRDAGWHHIKAWADLRF